MMQNRPIGGYFELELPPPQNAFLSDGQKYQSARAAFHALLLRGSPKKVWMPNYLCDSMFTPLKVCKIEYETYSVNSDFSIVGDLDLGVDHWLFCVNYFGVCGPLLNSILEKYPAPQVIVDNSQALFAAPLRNLATIYSPRKFVGVPDGGILFSEMDMVVQPTSDLESLERGEYLLKRMAFSPESGYNDYQKAEASLSDSEPKKMSKMTNRILSSVDFESIRNIRTRNFYVLHRALGNLNYKGIDLGSISAPLCYPFFVHNGAQVRSALLQERIFVAKYWPEVIERKISTGAEMMLVENCLPLPIDQRYEEKDLQRIIDVCLKNVMA